MIAYKQYMFIDCAHKGESFLLPIARASMLLVLVLKLLKKEVKLWKW